MKMILGKKLGSSQIFSKDGKVIPVSIIEANPGIVIRKIEGKKGSKVLVAFIEAKKISKSVEGEFKKAKIDKKLKRFAEINMDAEVGTEIKVDQFSEKDIVDVSGVSKGKGFAGVIKRHNFSRGPESHGSDHHRAPGSIGSMFPQHVYKGRKMPGHMGNQNVTTKNLEIVKIIPEKNLMLVRGAVPGHIGGIVKIREVKNGK